MIDDENNLPAPDEETFSLNDDRRVKTLSPAALTARRFFRNRLAVAGLVILGVLFLFSFVGGALSPYSQEQVFYRDEPQLKEFAAVTRNDTFRFTVAPGQEFGAVAQAQFALALGKKDVFSYRGANYEIVPVGTDFYRILTNNTPVAIAHKDIVSPVQQTFAFTDAALTAYTQEQTEFAADGSSYQLNETGEIFQGNNRTGYISRLILQSRTGGADLSADFRAVVADALEQNADSFVYRDRTFTLVYDAANKLWSIREITATRVWDSYAPPSPQHPLGTDKNGMDMLTRLMYGGRISLVIGFIVVLIAAVLGVILGGTAGYFGGWTDNLIMRLVDIFYCVPSTPLLIILGAVMDGMRLDPQLRMLYLMLILGFLNWPGIARLVRGQILSLREQEFMTATEAAGLKIRRRIFRHLLPNVIPQLIVTCTMSLGSTIITEATLSFLGLGVKFPFASWGNIMNDVSNAHVLTSYWFVWIPAGVCLVLAVLGFNFVGDGLRDAFDPKMKR